MRPHADYIALGHIHKPFEYEGWVNNPGSLESCSVEEAEWETRGYLLVEVDTERPRGERHTVTRVHTPRRPIVRLTVKAEEHESHDALCSHCCTLAERRVVHDLNGGRFGDHGPIVEVVLTGVLNFESYELRLREIEEKVREATGALCVLPRNVTLSRQQKVVDPNLRSRAELEQQVLATLFARDSKYRPLSERWAAAAVELKNLALANTPAVAVLAELDALIDRVHAPEPDPESEPVF
jgi:DNA repair exonuclease SbcCD nuclease subunit